jgi:deazaflavin-dependent oxidoreductase (nitroreductase family)
MTQTYDFDEMNRTVIREFRDTGGKAGGVFEGIPLVLVHHIGVKSGIERIAPLVPLLEDGRIFVFASKGGSEKNPHWYGNLLAHPQITVEFGTETFLATARVVTGAERDDIYARQSALEPQFAEHQRNTKRLIPVIELVRSENN